MQLIAGLGNPGDVYKDTPHNIGFITIDQIGQILGLKGNQKRFGSDLQRFSEDSNISLFLKPGTYMNHSGEPIAACARYFKIPPERILIICDDIDLPVGKVRFRSSGGHGGHNGLRSVIENLGTENFLRARIGIGRPDSSTEITGFVLGKMEESKKRLYMLSMDIVVEALLLFVKYSRFKNTSMNISNSSLDST